jgi:uncharacterized membrane protein YhaH (DUF805 family)
MHHDFWMTILTHVAICKAVDMLKQLVQAVALYILVVRFVLFFIASYLSQPHPLAGLPNAVSRCA